MNEMGNFVCNKLRLLNCERLQFTVMKANFDLKL